MAEQNPVVRSSRRLPSGRAVIGALLITLSVLAVLLVIRLDEDSSFREVVVARRDLAPGTVVASDDVTLVRIRLDQSVESLFSDPQEVTGSVLLGPVARLDLLQRSQVADPTSAGEPGGLAEVTVAVEPDRAPADLAPGELVSILATFTDDDPDRTVVVADRIVVLSYQREGDDFGGDAVLRLGLGDGQKALDIVHAAQTGELSVLGIMSAPDLVLPIGES